MARSLLLCPFLATLAACGSMRFEPPPADWPTTWAGRTLHATPDLLVVASDAGAAEDAHGLVAASVDLWRRESGRDPGRGLVLAMDYGSELPVADPLAWLQKVIEWHRVAVRAPGQSGVRTKFTTDGDVAVDLRKLASIAAGALPIPGNQLGLPEAWLAAVRWVLVVPTRACMAAAVDDLIDAGLDQKLSFVERMLAAPFVPLLKGKARSELERQVRVRILEVCFAAGSDDVVAEAARFREWLERADVPAHHSVFVIALPDEGGHEPR